MYIYCMQNTHTHTQYICINMEPRSVHPHTHNIYIINTQLCVAHTNTQYIYKHGISCCTQTHTHYIETRNLVLRTHADVILMMSLFILSFSIFFFLASLCVRMCLYVCVCVCFISLPLPVSDVLSISLPLKISENIYTCVY